MCVCVFSRTPCYYDIIINVCVLILLYYTIVLFQVNVPPIQKKRSTKYKRERRKRYRTKKKELWQELALDAYRKRCQERIAKSNAMHAAEIVELKKREEKERLQAIELTRLRETQILQRSEEISHIEDTYTNLAGTSGSTSETVTNTTCISLTFGFNHHSSL